jgi:3-deoxy-D-arabino-heptulosonate 7-phosphate (DAHP) synthase
MSPEDIMNNDAVAARKTKSHDHAEIASHVAAKEGVKHEKTHTTNSVASKKSEITLKGGCLLSTNLKLMNC